MRVCGFTFIRNAIKFDYPVAEAVQSVLPLCDEFIIVTGNSEDNTRNLIERIDSPKIKIIDSIWDDSLRTGGRVLASETNKAIDSLPGCDWAFYIQADEILHEKYYQTVADTMNKWKNDPRVEGLLFNYTHFYGSYDYVGDSSRWYRKEVRIIRGDKSIRSYRDAQGFRKNNRPLKVKSTDASIYHYGWVKPPLNQHEKQAYFHSLWHSEKWLSQNLHPGNEFDYSEIDSLSRFTGTHPAIMNERIQKLNWKFSFDPANTKLSFKNKLKKIVEKMTGWRIGEYRNYRMMK